MMSSYSSERASFHHDRKHKYVAIPAAPPSLGNHMFSFDSGCMHACMQAMDRESSEQFQEKERVRMELQTAWATCLFCYAFPQQPVGRLGMDGWDGWSSVEYPLGIYKFVVSRGKLTLSIRFGLFGSEGEWVVGAKLRIGVVRLVSCCFSPTMAR